jgi:hypothetical protein
LAFWTVRCPLFVPDRAFWIAEAHRGDGKRCLKKERERNAHSPAPFMKTNNNFFVSYSSPEAAHGPES